MVRRLLTLLVLFLLSVSVTRAQSLDLPVRHYGISVGHSDLVYGLRFNYRDRGPVHVYGMNTTLWTPFRETTGAVNGIALGLPLTGAGTINGLALGVFGVAADDAMNGLGIGLLGTGSGERMNGIFLGGLGLGTGGHFSGIGIGGLGVGAGDDVTGVVIGGLGAGAGENLTGVGFGGLGIGAGENASGIFLGGLGVGAGKRLSGIAVALLGVGAGEDLTGIAVGGLGVGSGGTLRGLGLAGLGVGARRVEGVMISMAAAGGEEVTGLSIAPAYFKVARSGYLHGISISAFNDIRYGEQRGLAIGILNIADRLQGIQLGLINVARNNRPGLKVLPIVNAHFN